MDWQQVLLNQILNREPSEPESRLTYNNVVYTDDSHFSSPQLSYHIDGTQERKLVSNLLFLRQIGPRHLDLCLIEKSSVFQQRHKDGR